MNGTLSVPLVVTNPDNLPLTFSVSVVGQSLPGFDQTTSVSGSPSGGLFVWTPVASHVGEHSLLFTIQSSAGSSSQSSVITVVAASDTAPVFLQPGAGATYDLTRNPCVDFDIEVRDDAASTLTIGAAGDLPMGAMLMDNGDKSGHFHWCPTPDEISMSLRWTIALSANDGSHAPVEHDFVVVLLPAMGMNCGTGAPPSVAITSPAEGASVVYDNGFAVSATVTDDHGLSSAPLLFYSTTAPDDLTNPDVTTFELVSLSQNGTGSTYDATIPTLGLAPGDTATVYVLVSATDNDDPTNAACDHTTRSALLTFTAVGAMATSTGVPGDPCTSSFACASNICSEQMGSRVCVAACAGSMCNSGLQCSALATVEGSNVMGCIAPSCVDDSREPNDTIMNATTFSSAITDGAICPNNSDYFAISGTSQTRVSVTMADASGALELALLGSDGHVIGTASIGTSEELDACFDASGTLYARVYGAPGGMGAYTLTTAPASGSCCMPDSAEPNNTLATATPVTLVGNTADISGGICPGDVDYFSVTLASSAALAFTLVYDANPGGNAFSAQLYDSTGLQVAASTDASGSSDIAPTTLAAGTYVIRISGSTDAGGDYLATVTTSAAATCTTDMSCTLGNVCRATGCGTDTCAGASDCGSLDFCPAAGPGGARNCAATCTTNAACRTGEACKWFADGRGCGRKGSGANGAACANHADCNVQRACLSWPGGYCARAGCHANSDCESGSTFCATVSGANACVVDCHTNPSLCRTSDGYSCAAITDAAGASRFACLPGTSG